MSSVHREKSLQLIQQYRDDPSNNSTALAAAQLIVSLPLCSETTAISGLAKGITHECTIKFLQDSWEAMNRHVYGHFSAKNEILEYLVSLLMRELREDKQPSPRVLGLVGPPGVGKTTLAMNGISQALHLPFYHLSVGGLRDSNFFSGTLRCWKGAHQGVFTDILIKTGCNNPVIYIDEIDKVAEDTAQDIYGILTHATDPMTNKHISDYFLGVDLDLSRVTFVFSYNDACMLPAPLRDRIKEIALQGFNEDDLTVIARDFVIPRCLKEYGIRPEHVRFPDDVIRYANNCFKMGLEEGSGVRYLNRGYQSVIGKVIVNLVAQPDTFLSIIGGDDRGKRKKDPATAPAWQRQLPYYRPVRLPYILSTEDIDFYSAI
jgi:ATP-dependent Lon protease